MQVKTLKKSRFFSDRKMLKEEDYDNFAYLDSPRTREKREVLEARHGEAPKAKKRKRI